jgi:hypothetical protein
MHALAKDVRGVVYAEFLIAFTPFFLLFLGIVQLSFIAAGSLTVQTAAVKAVRAAAVILDDDPIFYGTEPRGLLDFDGSSDDDGWVNSVGGMLTENGDANWLSVCNVRDAQNRCCASLNADGSCNAERTNQLGQLQNRGGPRLRAIRRAAYLPLAAISPEWGQVVAWFGGGLLNISGGDGQEDRYSLRRTGIGTGPAWRFVTGFLAWNPIAAAVNFPVAPRDDQLRNQTERQVCYGRYDKVTVRVTYLYPCGVPIANLFVCRSLFGMTGIGDTIDGLENIIENASVEDLQNVQGEVTDLWNNQTAALDEAQRNFRELQAGAEYPAFQFALMFAQGARFHILRREATLPIQGAPYEYPTAADYPPEDNPCAP